jgi:Family of unknown function (DUF5832)
MKPRTIALNQNEIALPSGAVTTNYTQTVLHRPSANDIRALCDNIRVPNINFVVMSCAAQGLAQVTSDNKCAIKLRGAFNTVEEANEHAVKLQEEDPYFDIYVAPMYEWLVIPPETSYCSEVHLPNQKIEEIINRELLHRHETATKLEQRIQSAKDQLNCQDVAMID